MSLREVTETAVSEWSLREARPLAGFFGFLYTENALKRLYFFLVTITLGLMLVGCSVNKMAAKALGGAGGGAAAVFASDEDPELVGEALPLALKVFEMMLDANPEDAALGETTGSLFVMYANAFVQGPAFLLPPQAFEEKTAANERAKKLYIRGSAMLEASLLRKFPKLKTALAASGQADEVYAEVKAAVSGAKPADAPALYWFAAGTLAAYALDTMDFTLGVRIPAVKAMIDAAYDKARGDTLESLDELCILYYASVPAGLSGDSLGTPYAELAQQHFDKSVERTAGLAASPYVSWAETVCVSKQDYAGFQRYLNAALAIDVNADKTRRLVNVLAQRKARFMLENADRWFAEAEGADGY